MANDLEEELRETGLRLASEADRDEGFDAGAVLDAAHAHIVALIRAGMIPDALGVGVGALLTVFRRGFIPEDYRNQYLRGLLDVATAGAIMQQMPESADPFVAQHLEAIDAELGPLAWESYKALADENVSQEVKGPLSHLGEWVAPHATFRGERVTHHMALDILYDIAARLAALGM